MMSKLVVSAWFAAAVLLHAVVAPAWGDAGDAVRDRLKRDAGEGRPLVVHVVVALCDNKNQGIVPVPEKLGNGQDPANNLYWGAMYGVKSYLPKKAGWTLIDTKPAARQGVLDSAVMRRGIRRGDKTIDAYLVAEAWDGKEIRNATIRFLRLAAGGDAEAIEVPQANGTKQKIDAGGASHVVAYVGHDGLMDFKLNESEIPSADKKAGARSSIVLACKSRDYFAEPLKQGGSHRLLMTTGLMSPEAYTLDAGVNAWLAGQDATQTRDAAAEAYDKFQKCGLNAAKKLFATE